MEVYRLYDDTDRAAGLPEAQRASLEITATGEEVALRFCNGPDDFGREFYLTQESAANLGHLLAMVAGEPLPGESSGESATRETRRREALIVGIALTIAATIVAASITATVLICLGS